MDHTGSTPSFPTSLTALDISRISQVPCCLLAQINKLKLRDTGLKDIYRAAEYNPKILYDIDVSPKQLENKQDWKAFDSVLPKLTGLARLSLTGPCPCPESLPMGLKRLQFTRIQLGKQPVVLPPTVVQAQFIKCSIHHPDQIKLPSALQSLTWISVEGTSLDIDCLFQNLSELTELKIGS